MIPRAARISLAPAVAALLIAASAPRSDILPPNRRQETVDRAMALAQPPAPRPVPGDLPRLFTPPDAPMAEVDSATTGSNATAAPAAPAQPAPPADRVILETLAARLVPSGTLEIGGARQLVIGQKRFQVGTRFVVSFNNEDYELELVSIDRTTFTLRYGSEEITRPIKPVR